MEVFMANYIFENMQSYYPFLSERMVSYKKVGPYELIVKTNDGETILYDDINHSIRRLPRDSNNMTEQEVSVEFRQRLRRLMTRQGVSQLELSELTGIPQSTISNYLTGKFLPGFYNMDKIAKALKCSIDEFRYTE
jgi:predicted XRE-type DNA-binding protein